MDPNAGAAGTAIRAEGETEKAWRKSSQQTGAWAIVVICFVHGAPTVQSHAGSRSDQAEAHAVPWRLTVGRGARQRPAKGSDRQ